MAELALGVARTDDQQQSAMTRDLMDVAGGATFDSIPYRHFFAEQLPAVDVAYGHGAPPLKLFASGRRTAREAAAAGCRLKSPNHYRIYFALAQPSHALTTADLDSFWSAAAIGPDAVHLVMLTLHAVDTGRSIGKADLLNLCRHAGLKRPGLSGGCAV